MSKSSVSETLVCWSQKARWYRTRKELLTFRCALKRPLEHSAARGSMPGDQDSAISKNEPVYKRVSSMPNKKVAIVEPDIGLDARISGLERII